VSLAFSSKSSKEERIGESVINGENLEYSAKHLRLEARYYKMLSGGDPSGPKRAT